MLEGRVGKGRKLQRAEVLAQGCDGGVMQEEKQEGNACDDDQERSEPAIGEHGASEGGRTVEGKDDRKILKLTEEKR